MAVPEGVVDGEDGVPEDLVVGTGVGRGGGHPSEVGEDVGLGLELLPLGGLLCAEDGGVVLGLEPGAYLMGGDGGDEVAPLAEAAELALVVGEEAGHVALHTVDLEGGEDVGASGEGSVSPFVRIGNVCERKKTSLFWLVSMDENWIILKVSV